LTLAFAISIAVHEIVAGTIPSGRSQSALRETVSSAQIAQITRQVTPAPTATPEPQPIVTPRPVFATTAPAPVARVARSAAGSPRRIAVRRTMHSEANARPVWDTAAGESSNVAMTVADGQSTNSGTGVGLRGNGAGSASGEPPCGFVTFSDPHGSHFDTQTRGFWVDIRMSVHFADGSSQSVLLDYPWYYSSEALNPWSDQNLKDPNFPTRFQPPPPAKASGEPPVVQYVVTHSTPDGMTLLKDCP
jgi:hypothetical protein